MGSDIRGFLEVKKKRSKSWKKMCGIPTGRCYNMFGLLNNFRNYLNVPPLSDINRGFPEDVSSYVQNVIDNDIDIVAPSHLYWEDFEKYDYNQSFPIFDTKSTLVFDEKTGEKIKADCITPQQIIYKCGWTHFLAIMKDLAKLHGSKGVRIVFWYDN